MSEKLYTFFEVAEVVYGTERCVRFKDGEWILLNHNLLPLYFDAGLSWHPEDKELKARAWTVEPEKPEEVFVWVVCDEDGTSRIINKPDQKLFEKHFSAIGGFGLPLPDSNLFPKEPQKCKLVVVEDK